MADATVVMLLSGSIACLGGDGEEGEARKAPVRRSFWDCWKVCLSAHVRIERDELNKDWIGVFQHRMSEVFQSSSYVDLSLSYFLQH